MLGVPSIYAYLAGGVAVLGVIGGFYALDASKNHYKHLYQTDEAEIIRLEVQLNDMTVKQENQITTSGKNVVTVVQGPDRIKTVIKTIHDAPEPKDCGTPVLPEDIQI